MSFNFGITRNVGSGTNTFSFGSSGTSTAVSKEGFSVAPASKTTTPAPSGGFFAPKTTSGGFSFGLGGATGMPTTTTSNTLSSSTTVTTGSQGFSFGLTPAVTTVSSSTTTTASGVGFSFGTTVVSTTSSISAAPPSFNLQSLIAPTTSAPASNNELNFGLNSKATTASSSIGGFSFGASTTITATTTSATLGTLPSFQMPVSSDSSSTAVSKSMTSAPGSSLFLAPKATSTSSTLSAPVTTVGLSTATTTSSSSVAPGTTMTYRQLEEAVNKWTIELEEQEKIFLNQATQVNAWDRIIFENGEKIVSLHDNVERVKTDQTRLEHELDFIKGLQSELEDVLKPLEASVAETPSTVDVEREKMYVKAEQLDAQLHRMSEDLKEIIEHINAQNRSQESSNDPVIQIGKVLNAHMDSLQWVDQNMSLVQKKLAEVTQLHELKKKESERTGIF